jgi:AcrR family transcriptional regulator
MARSLSEDAREKMLAAAVDVVLDVGVARFSVDEVTRRSGVAKTTIYRHFPDPKVMLVAALDRAMPPPPIPDTGSLAGDLRAYLVSVTPLFADPTLRTVFFEVFVAGWRDPELGALAASLLRGRTGPTRAIYEHATARSELAPDVDYATLVEIVQGPFVMRALGRPDTMADPDVDALVDRMLLVLARGQ